MTTYAEVEIKGKSLIVKIGGYTGKTEAPSGPPDIANANRIWLTKDQKNKVGLKYGQRVKVNIGYGIERWGEVHRWSGGSAQIVFNEPLDIKMSTARKISIPPQEARKIRK